MASEIGYRGDHVVSVRDPLGQVDSTEYDALGDVTRHFGIASAALATTARYDLAGRPTSSTNRRGQRVDVTYDALGRVLTKSGDNTTTDRFSYSANGLIQTAANVTDSIRTVVVPGSRRDTVQTVLGGHTYTVVHYASAQTAGTDSMTIATDGPAVFPTRRYVGDAATGGLAGIDIGTLGASSFAYDAAARRVTAAWPGGAGRTDTYFTTGAHNTQSYGPLALANAFSVSYAVDSAARLLRDHRLNAQGTAYVNRVFGYDAAGRFTGVTDASQDAWTCGGSGSFSPDYGYLGCPIDSVPAPMVYWYDGVGNRYNNFYAGTIYDAGDRLRQLPDTAHGAGALFSYTYDADGNVATRTRSATGETWTYTWSAEGRLTGVTHAVYGTSDPAVTFGSDAVGEPVTKTRGGVLERLSLYDGGALIADLAADGSREAECVYDAGVDAPYAVLTGATTVTGTEYLAQDDFGNVQGTWSGTSAVQAVHYGDWGTPVVQGDTANRLLWKGLAFDRDAGLYWMRARWYDPAAGRFVSEDPAGLAGGINPYVFAGDDPVNGSDPAGLTAYISMDDRCQYSYTIGSPDVYFEIGGCDFGSGGSGTSNPFANDVPWAHGDGPGPTPTSRGGGGSSTGTHSPTPAAKSKPQNKSSLDCAEEALGNNWKGLALDGLGWIATATVPEGSVATAVVGSTLGVVGIGLAVTDNRGPADAAASGVLAYTGKQAAVVEGLLRGSASALGRRIGFYALIGSSAYDVGKTALDYQKCTNGRGGDGRP